MENGINEILTKLKSLTNEELEFEANQFLKHAEIDKEILAILCPVSDPEIDIKRLANCIGPESPSASCIKNYEGKLRSLLERKPYDKDLCRSAKNMLTILSILSLPSNVRKEFVKDMSTATRQQVLNGKSNKYRFSRSILLNCVNYVGTKRFNHNLAFIFKLSGQQLMHKKESAL